MQIHIDFTGLKRLSNELEEYAKKIENTEPLMGEIANHLVNITEDSFEHEKTPNGIPWSPIKVRKNDRRPDKILFNEGSMQNSLYSESSKDEAIVALNATANGYPYAIPHQFGTEDGRIKARAFMPINEDGTLYDSVEKELIELVEDFVKLD